MTFSNPLRRPIRVYGDTSVFGGCFDNEFRSASRKFFDQVRDGAILLVVSDLVQEELEEAPQRVKDLFDEYGSLAELREVSEEAILLQQAYLTHGVVGPASMSDALHVALATVAECLAIVSWNIKHIVNFRRISLYNGVNKLEGWREIAIHTPLEVISDEE